MIPAPHTWTFRRIGAGHHQLRAIHAAGQSEASVDRRPSASFAIRRLSCSVRSLYKRVKWYFQPRALAVFSVGVLSAEHASLTFACPRSAPDKQEDERESRSEAWQENLGVKARDGSTERSDACLQIGLAFLGIGVTEEARHLLVDFI